MRPSASAALPFLFLCRLPAAAASSSPWALPQTVLDCQSALVFASTASAALDKLWVSEKDAPGLVLLAPKTAPDGCAADAFAAAAAPTKPWAAVVARGGACSFKTKLDFAVRSGASAVLIINNLRALYNATTGRLLNPCSINCDVARESTKTACEAKIAGSEYVMCSSRTLLGDAGEAEWCAVEDKLIDMYLGMGDSAVPAAFVSIKDGLQVTALALQEATCRIYLRPSPVVDPSVVVLCFIGCLAVTLGSYRAARQDRWRMLGLVSSADASQLVETEDHLDMTPSLVAGFICSTTVSILILFFIVQYFPFFIVGLIQIVFVLGSSGALSLLFFHGLCRRLMGEVMAETVVEFHCGCGHATKSELAGYLMGSAVAWTWYFCRHSSWAWVLLDGLALAMATVFLLSVRVPSLRVASVLLVSFFVYDIFMVFVTPLFGGRSVMVDVATAGRGSERPMEQECVRQQTERMPMLFAVPRFDWVGGYSMLGLGDVVLPGMLVTLGLRFDYALANTVSPASMYWVALLIAYALGLGVTFAANINEWTFNGVKGQPALMYLVPATLTTFFLKAKWRGNGELARAWSGNLAGPLDEHTSDLRSEVGDNLVMHT